MNLSQFCYQRNRLPDASRANFEYFTRKSTLARVFPSWSQYTGGTVSRSTRRLKTKHLIRQNCSLIQYLCVNHDGLFIHDIFKQAAVPGSCNLKTQIRKWLVTGANASTAAERFLESCLLSHLLSERQFIENNQLFCDTSCIVLRSLLSTLELPPVVFLPWTDMSNGLSCKPYGMPKSLFLCFSSKVNTLNWVCGSSLDTHTWLSGLQAADAGFWNVVAPVGEALIKTTALKLRGRKGERLPRNV